MISPKYSIIVVTPVYEDAEASSQLFKDLSTQFGSKVFVVAVDDGSVRQPLTINSLHDAGIDGVLLKLRRNVGHQQAIAVGLGHVCEHINFDKRLGKKQQQCVVVMDSDGEDAPSSVSELVSKLETADIDLVVAQRKSRKETWRFKAFYAFYKSLFKLMTGRKISFGNFMALKPHALLRLTAMQELSLHLAGAVLASKLRIKLLPIDRGERFAGQSRMNFVSLALHGFRGFMIFAEDVLVRVGVACLVIAVLSILGITMAITLKVIGFSTPGWFSIALGILVLTFLQTGALVLMTLLLTGIVRSGSVSNTNSYRDFIEQIIKTSSQK